MKMIRILFILFITLFPLPVYSAEITFDDWLKDFKKYALKKKNIRGNF